MASFTYDNFRTVLKRIGFEKLRSEKIALERRLRLLRWSVGCVSAARERSAKSGKGETGGCRFGLFGQLRERWDVT